MTQRVIEIFVGLFIVLALVALLVLAIRVSGFTGGDTKDGYVVTAEFDNIGGLKVNAPVQIAGVKVGEVVSITLDQQTFRADVTMDIFSKNTMIPSDSSASIFTAGILGAQYISLTPGFATTNLTDQSQIQATHSALILENLIGQLVFNMNKK